ncbi:MAG: hypothetical protein QGG14_07880, partial [Planctomycetota bacterium]|nr:hypothetical protein [Planctomycetota bacterium]
MTLLAPVIWSHAGRRPVVPNPNHESPMQRAFTAFFLAALTAVCLGTESRAQGTPIGFAEDWALAPDRAKVLGELIPGTPDYYYYHCLHSQDAGAFEKVQPLLKAWIQRHGRTQRVIRIENRQALLTFDKEPAATLQFLQQRLGLRFDHARKVSGAKRDLPTRLDQDLISLAAFTRRALQKHRNTVGGFRPSAFEALLATGLDDDLLLSLLSRLRRPDVANLPSLIVRNLKHRRSRGFGSLGIHKRLLLAQLDECARLRPALLNERAYVDAYLRRLAPSADVDWQHDAAARLAYLARLEAFTGRLASAHNSLKAHVLYRRLQHDRAAGTPDRDRLVTYLRLPRNASYSNPIFVRRHRGSGEMVQVGRKFATGLKPVGNDEPLVRAYLMHFFAEADSYATYAETVREDYLRRLFAETKILRGVGDMERWYSLLDDPSYYEKLRQRVEIEFAPTQRRFFGADDAVSLTVDIKNVDKLLVKIFEINTFNYFRGTGRDVDTSINLDGLIANHELTREYTDAALRRVRRSFDLPQLKGAGVWVVELIGNGLSSRAVIHKGRLQYTERLGSAGHVFTVRDETGAAVSKASIWFGGKTYQAEADANGEIVLPYSTKPGRRSVILQHGGLSTLTTFYHSAEVYTLRAGIHLDRESLLAGRRSRILVRPALDLNGRPVSLQLLQDPVLAIRARDRDGVDSTLNVRGVKLAADRESVHEIQVPEGLAELVVTLRGRVKSLSRNQRLDLTTRVHRFKVNEIDRTPLTACPLLGRNADGYVLDVLGKSGEAKPGRAVSLVLRHRDYTDPFTVSLKTDAKGRIRLGALAGIGWVQASGLPKSVGFWSLRRAKRTYPANLHAVAGETLRVPYLGDERTASRTAISLLQHRSGQFVRDAFEHVVLAEGFVELRGLPAGDYSLWLKEAEREIKVRVTSGKRRAQWAVGRHRMLEAGARKPIHIASVDVGGDDLLIRLVNAGKEARVHVVATRYLPPFDPFTGLAVARRPGLGVVAMEHAESFYHSGREIGDEYRYILDRRFAKKYPGNMLKRPGLILNPWALDEEALTRLGFGGGASSKFGGRGRSRRGAVGGGAAPGGVTGPAPGTFANLEFLPAPARMLANLRPDAEGIVRVPLKDLGNGQHVHVLAVDAEETVYLTATRPEQTLTPRGRELARALDGKTHVTERRRIEFVPKDGRAVVKDITTVEMETYDSLSKVYRLFASLTGNGDLAKFAFVLLWPELKLEEKRALYDEHACHELHFFLHEKDPEFFAQVVRPHLSNKAHQTFLDEWLLGADLRHYLE